MGRVKEKNRQLCHERFSMKMMFKIFHSRRKWQCKCIAYTVVAWALIILFANMLNFKTSLQIKKLCEGKKVEISWEYSRIFHLLKWNCEN
jgi:hypothetical protein